MDAAIRARRLKLERQQRYEATPRGQYVRHKQNARRRGVPFELTFTQWWDIWQASGYWRYRGNRLGCYCMARLGDRGPYAVGNVRIAEWSVNTAECNRTRHAELLDNPRPLEPVLDEEHSTDVPF